ncbi:MAG: family 16 glycoside hydrolase [Planctomycetaceae bacterium]
MLTHQLAPVTRPVIWLLVLCLVPALAGCDAGSSTEQAPSSAVNQSSTPPAENPDSGAAAGAEPDVAPEPAVEAPQPVSAAKPAPPMPVDYINPITAEDAATGWISLFDGASLFGWRLHEGGANWRVEDQAIVVDDGPKDLLCTSVPFKDYELRLEFRQPAGGNSGVFLRTSEQPQNPAEDCYELNIADEHPEGFTTGSFVGRQKTAEPVAASTDWRKLHVVAEGQRFTVTLDGVQVLDYTDEGEHQQPTGLIGLQKNEGRIEFKNIRLRPLTMTDLFNGQDLTGWRVVPDLKSEFSVVDGEIHVVNGLGFLESEGAWADFVFQAEAKTNAPELNSGYFFRALPIEPGGNCNGYEAQISNALINGDRRNPKDHGTGAIFRRTKARYVVPNDGEWFTTTLVAAGPQFAVWVDGYQVVDWTDTRPAAENPREGQRLGLGHIALQGHDPTTDLNFRNLRIADLQ